MLFRLFCNFISFFISFPFVLFNHREHLKKGETSAFREPQVLLKRPLTGNGNLRRVKSRRCTAVVREEIREKEENDGSTGRSTRSWGRRRGRGGWE